MTTTINETSFNDLIKNSQSKSRRYNRNNKQLISDETDIITKKNIKIKNIGNIEMVNQDYRQRTYNEKSKKTLIVGSQLLLPDPDDKITDSITIGRDGIPIGREGIPIRRHIASDYKINQAQSHTLLKLQNYNDIITNTHLVEHGKNPIISQQNLNEMALLYNDKGEINWRKHKSRYIEDEKVNDNNTNNIVIDNLKRIENKYNENGITLSETIK